MKILAKTYKNMNNYNYPYSYNQQQQQQGRGRESYNGNTSFQQSQYSFNQVQMNPQAMGCYNSQNQNYQNQNYNRNYNNYQNNRNNQSFNQIYNDNGYARNDNYNKPQQYNNNFQYDAYGRQDNRSKQRLNASVSYKPNLQHPFNNSFVSDTGGWSGVAQVGRFGGKKKKAREQCGDLSVSSSAQSKKSNEPKIKQPTVKEESSNEFYFPVHTETTTYVECPFNATHMMEPQRLMTHINKCKLKSENAKHFSVCPYDPCHYFYTTQIEAHILVCDKRSLFVVSDWDSTVLNTSTTSSIPQSSENQLLVEAVKAPSSKLQDADKINYEDDHLIDV